jgi:hypothetical protein
VRLLLVDDLGMRKLPATAAEELLDRDAAVRTYRHSADLEPLCRAEADLSRDREYARRVRPTARGRAVRSSLVAGHTERLRLRRNRPDARRAPGVAFR